MFDLLDYLKRDALLFTSDIHGLYHWKCVERNGVYLSQFNGADVEVVRYFAFFHDCMRENEGLDSGHGPRAGKYIKKLKDALPLTQNQINDLCQACIGHTFGRKEINVTISTCWDADRLDIGRVGTTPHSDYLFSEEAKRIADEDDQQALLSFAYESLV